MNSRVLLGAVGLAGTAILLGQVDVGAFFDLETGNTSGPDVSDRSEGEFVPTGGYPDVYTFALSGIANWAQGEFRAYSVGTTSCNQGSVPLLWHPNDNQHPVIAQNLFRYRIDEKGHGRFEQLAQGWLKHGFCALDLDGCGSCQATGCISLGVGCSDPYTATRNGTQGDAGPKYQVNATTGAFPYPPADPAWSGSLDRRIHVPVVDVDPALNPGAQYFFEAQYVHPQDNPASTPYIASSNNASYRKVNMGAGGVATSYDGVTVVKKPAILAWNAIDNKVSAQSVIFASEGVIRVSSRAYYNGDGTWDYEYAVHNLDFDRSVGGFTVPVPDSVTVTEVGFQSVEYHSGEPFSNDPWVPDRIAGEMTWTTQTHEENENANAIRWGTMYNMRYTADGPPHFIQNGGNVVAFKPGTPESKIVTVVVPSDPVACRGDVDGDLAIGFQDLIGLLHAWGPCADCYSDLDEDGDVDFDDLSQLLVRWGECG